MADKGDSSRRFSFSSTLAAAPAEVWAHAMSIRGVNRELFPVARMTCPRGLGRDLTRLPLGRRAFRSWILAAGIVPIDGDDLTFVELDPGRRFLERSSMLKLREWCHERTVEPAAQGSIITDRVRFVPRVPVLGALFLPIFRLSFRVRHWNLRRMFAGRAIAPAASAELD